MKRFLAQLVLAMAVLLAVTISPPPAYARQVDQDATAPKKSDPVAPPQYANEAQMPASGETTTQTAKTFSGMVVKEDGEIVLKDPVTKVIYKLDDVTKAKQFMGKRVKVTGKLEMNSNRILMEGIEPAS
jgi:hypothetical protein